MGQQGNIVGKDTGDGWLGDVEGNSEGLLGAVFPHVVQHEKQAGFYGQCPGAYPVICFVKEICEFYFEGC